MGIPLRDWIVVPPDARRDNARHEGTHAVFAEVVAPGYVSRVECFMRLRKLSEFSEHRPPGEPDGYLRGITVPNGEVLNREAEEYGPYILFIKKLAIIHAPEATTAGSMCKWNESDGSAAHYLLSLASNSGLNVPLICSAAAETIQYVAAVPSVAHAVQEVADRGFRNCIVSGDEIRRIVAERISQPEAILARRHIFEAAHALAQAA